MRFIITFFIAGGLLASSALAQLSTWQLREPRLSPATVVGGSRIVIAGGVTGFALSDLVEVRAADGSFLDFWTLSLPRFRHGGAFVNGRFYFAGGSVPPFNLMTDRVDSFDIFGDLNQLTLPMASGTEALAGIGDLLMVCGGFNLLPSTSGRYASLIQILDTTTGQWSTRSIPFVTADADATDRWLVVAGNDSIIPGNGAIEVYDGASETWRGARGLFLPLRPELVVVDDAAYLFSTSDMDSFGLRIDLFDLSLEQIPLLQGRNMPELAVADHVICRSNGGLFGVQGLSRTADLYDTLTREWREVDLGAGLHLRGAASDRASGTAVFAGGAGATQPFGRERVDLVSAERSMESLVCSNPDPNSTGQPSSLQASGIRAADVNLFSLIVDDLPAFCFGGALVSPDMSSPVALGNTIGDLCLGSPQAFVQASPLRADASGRMLIGLDLGAIPFSTPIAVTPGSTWYFQAWYRDRDPLGAVTRLSDGVSVQFE